MYNNKRQIKKQTKPVVQPLPNTIEVEYVKIGEYDILTTYDFGYTLQIRTKLEPYKEDDGKLYLTYNMRNAVLAGTESGYMVLLIKE